jgi:hypothetical protein
LGEDAVLRACGICVYELQQVHGVPLPLLNRAAALVQNPSLADGSGRAPEDPPQSWGARVLLRRAMWVLACYRANLSRELRAASLEMLGRRLVARTEHDVPIALTAAATLHSRTHAVIRAVCIVF